MESLAARESKDFLKRKTQSGKKAGQFEPFAGPAEDRRQACVRGRKNLASC